MGVLIAAERGAIPISDLPATIKRERGETDILLSAITVIELEHGLYRAHHAERFRERLNVQARRAPKLVKA